MDDLSFIIIGGLLILLAIRSVRDRERMKNIEDWQTHLLRRDDERNSDIRRLTDRLMDLERKSRTP